MRKRKVKSELEEVAPAIEKMDSETKEHLSDWVSGYLEHAEVTRKKRRKGRPPYAKSSD